MTKKHVIRLVAFILAACCTLVLLSDLFEQENTNHISLRYTAFHELNKNTLDAVFIGTSGVDRYWIGAKAYEEYGMTVYPLASDGMPAWLFVNQIKYICSRQDPKLIIVDARPFGQAPTRASKMEVQARRVLDAMPFFSVRYLEAAFTAMKVIQTEHPEEDFFKISYLLPFVKYHTKWEEDDYSIHANLSPDAHEYGGFLMSPSLSIRQKPHKGFVYDTTLTKELGGIYQDALYDLLAYAKEKDLQLLFVDTPQQKDEHQVSTANTIGKILAEEGVPYLNYCLTDDQANFSLIPELDRKTDFYNSGHVNYYGAEKFTAHLAKYLDENYDFEDHRQEAKAKEDWDGMYDRIKKTVEKFELDAAKKAAEKEAQ